MCMLYICLQRINYVFIHKQKSCHNGRLYVLFQTFIEVAAWKNIISKNRAGRILRHTTHVTIGAFQQTLSASYNRAEYTTARYKIHVTNISFTDMDSNLVLWHSLQQFKCFCFLFSLRQNRMSICENVELTKLKLTTVKAMSKTLIVNN